MIRLRRTIFAAAGQRPGTRGHNWPHPGRMGPCFVAGPYPLRCAALSPPAAAVGSFLRTPGPLLRRGPFPCAGPLRRGPPGPASRPRFARSAPRAFSALPGSGPGPFPPALPLGRLCAAVAAPRPLAGPVCLRARPCCGAAFLFGRPSFARPWPLCSAWPRRVPPWPAACWPSSLGPASPPRGFGPGASRPGACARLRRALVASGPRAAACGRVTSGGGCPWAALLLR